jgi:hypothetical protein
MTKLALVGRVVWRGCSEVAPVAGLTGSLNVATRAVLRVWAQWTVVRAYQLEICAVCEASIGTWSRC